MNWIKQNFMSLVFSLIILFIGIFHLGLPIYLDIFLSFTLALIINSWISSGITVIVLMIGFFTLNLVTHDLKINYRAHEMLATNDKSYVKNSRLNIKQPYGDLFAIGQNSKMLHQIVEPREIEFITDNRGNRNEKVLKSPDIILVGDSFVVGNGNTQKEILSEELSRITSKKVYNIAYPGNPKNYETALRKNYDLLNDYKNLFLFYFEGNDFTIPTKVSGQSSKSVVSKIKNFVIYLEDLKSNYLATIYPISFKLARLVNRKSRTSYLHIKAFIFGSSKKDNLLNRKVVIKLFGKKEVGFHSNYVDISLATNVNTYIWKDKDLISKIRAVVFIPTKYRVYNEISENVPLDTLRNGYVKYSVPVIDLTNILKEKAKKYLSQGKYVFWRDDTHWNFNGISVSAKYISKFL